MAEDAKITHAVAPKVAQGPFQRFAHRTRILSWSNALIYKVDNTPGGDLVEFPQLFL